MRCWLIVVLALAGIPGCGRDDSSPDLLSFNYCGNVCAAGSDEGAPFVLDLIAARDVSVVVMQEVCRSQAELLRSELERVWDRADLAYVTTFAEDLDGANRCVDDDYGMAVLAPTIVDEEIAPLPNPGLGVRQLDERKILCADVGDLVACTTHLVRNANDPEAHAAQIAEVRRFLAARKHERLVLAGDMNEPEALDVPGYVVGNHRLDHAYASASFVRDMAVRTARCDCSDHPALLVDLDRS